DIAATVVENWLTAKSRALSENHEIDVLETILVEPALGKWRNRASGAQRENWHFNYDHTVEILSVEPNDPGADALTAQVQVREVAEYYELGTRNLGESYDESLTMEYSLVRHDGEWFVKDMAAIDGN
ncbi:MAG: ARC6/PARC6 family protein, partial [Cyanobacteria bacterium P01_H01_bin.58]